MKKQGIGVVALALGALMLFSSCAAAKKTTSAQESSKSERGSLITEYILVRGDSSGNAVLRQVLNLKNAIDDRFGSNVPSSTDWAVDAEKDLSRREILIGVTNREESIAANEELQGVYGYVIRSVNDKIVITASTTGLLGKAVEQFTREYVQKNGGIVPEDINLRYTASLPLCVMSDPSCMKLLLSDKASDTLLRAAKDFSDRVGEIGGQFPTVEQSEEVSSSRIIFTFKDSVFSPEQETDRPSGLPEAEGDQMWNLTREGDVLTLEGEGERQLVAGLSMLYEHLEEQSDFTLDGQAVFFYEKAQVYRESWTGRCPRVIGAHYLGSESISGYSAAWYYEEVSQSDFYAWKLLLCQKAFGNARIENETQDESVFINDEENLQITAYYNRENRTMTVTEQALS